MAELTAPNLAGLRRHLALYHRTTNPDDLVVTDTPGYWEHKTPCGGREGGCSHPLHSTLFNDGPTRHTIQFLDPGRDERGRWASPYRTWRKARALQQEEAGHGD